MQKDRTIFSHHGGHSMIMALRVIKLSNLLTTCPGAQLRPHDARFWCAVGQCYAHEQLGMDEAAIRCYQRAHDSDDREGTHSASTFQGHMIRAA